MTSGREDVEIVYGLNPVLEILRTSPDDVRRVFLARRDRSRAERVVALARRAGVPVDRVHVRELDRRSPEGAHQGVLAEIAPFPYVPFDDLLERLPVCLVFADQVTDPRNLGALVRSAEAAGAGGVVLPRHRSARVTPVVIKASAGATASLPIARVTNLVRALEEAREAGYAAFGLDPAGSRGLWSLRFPERTALVVGSEGRGLRPLVRSTCDETITIPMAGTVASLNLSVAAGVVLYERLRQCTGERPGSVPPPPSY